MLPAMPSAEKLSLRTARLELIPIHRGHAPAMFAVLDDPTLYQFTGGLPPADVEALARLYAFWEDRTAPDGSELWFNWVLRLRERGDLIGHLQAGVAVDHAYLAWTLGARWQRRGYASEAGAGVVAWLRDLGVRELRASVHPAHAASIAVAERLGLRRTDRRSGAEQIWAMPCALTD